MSNKSFAKAKAAKNDEFYTQLHDIELEVLEYMDEDGGYSQFKDKVILCPCDDPASSNFTLFFALNFERFGLKKLISTSYNKEGGKGKIFIVDKDITGDGIVNQEDIRSEDLEGDGDFRSNEVKELREEADIIVTNPPFSLFREFLSWINPDEKKFLILGNMGAASYKEIFPLIKENKIWFGVKPMAVECLFDTTDEYKEEVVANKREGSGYRIVDGKVLLRAQCSWFTNLNHWRRNESMELVSTAMLKATGSITEYQKYDNYDAIEVPQLSIIPGDYDGVMGVPISFLDRYCPDQFEILGINQSDDKLKSKIYTKDDYPNYTTLNRSPIIMVNGKPTITYMRIFIRKKQ